MKKLQSQGIQIQDVIRYELYTLARTIQVCIYPFLNDPILSQNNWKIFLQKYDNFLGQQFSQILQNIFSLKYYNSFEEVLEQVNELISQNKNYKGFLDDNNNKIKYWQEQLIEKQKIQNLQLSIDQLIEQHLFFEKNALYKNQQIILEQIRQKFIKQLEEIQYNYKDINEKLNKTMYQEFQQKNYEIKGKIWQNELILGYCYSNQGLNYQSLETYNRVLKECQQINQQLCKVDKKLYLQERMKFYVIEADCLNLIGGVNQKLGNNGQAIQILLKSQKCFEKIIQKDSLQISPVLINLAFSYCQVHEPEKALKLYKKAYEIRKKQLPENALDLAFTFMGMGMCYLELKKYKEAQNSFEQAEKIYQFNNIKGGYYISDLYNNLGNLHFKLVKFEKALDYYQKSLKIMQQINGINHVNTCSILMNIAVIYKRIDQFLEAENLYQKVLEIKLNHNSNKNTPFFGDLYYNIGLLMQKQEKYQEAIINFKKSYNIRKQTLGINNPLTNESRNLLEATNQKLIAKNQQNQKSQNQIFYQSIGYQNNYVPQIQQSQIIGVQQNYQPVQQIGYEQNHSQTSQFNGNYTLNYHNSGQENKNQKYNINSSKNNSISNEQKTQQSSNYDANQNQNSIQKDYLEVTDSLNYLSDFGNNQYGNQMNYVMPAQQYYSASGYQTKIKENEKNTNLKLNNHKINLDKKGKKNSEKKQKILQKKESFEDPDELNFSFRNSIQHSQNYRMSSRQPDFQNNIQNDDILQEGEYSEILTNQKYELESSRNLSVIGVSQNNYADMEIESYSYDNNNSLDQNQTKKIINMSKNKNDDENDILQNEKINFEQSSNLSESSISDNQVNLGSDQQNQNQRIKKIQYDTTFEKIHNDTKRMKNNNQNNSLNNFTDKQNQIQMDNSQFESTNKIQLTQHYRSGHRYQNRNQNNDLNSNKFSENKRPINFQKSKYSSNQQKFK
ncbi:hypothetical protein PPERSA_11207 [Pseudocohnilembus persalinus]|uniref:Uncharacterized protein n=1 Tax=Pseudocohnilembus persalinus TaxID=266149 RepID=A0A0V0R025_PSEPJ|nr:hypothetical protein PPERSA_11207 [Pseudocohnilembus persalinus]|eukprot:KRX07658.1 hypothetical protein PPERSA_11207 [Pseudocohnilembus persalinus]